MFRSDGYLVVVAGTVVAAAIFAAALRLRSWPLWLLAFLLTVGTLLAAWWLRAPLDPTAYLPVPSA